MRIVAGRHRGRKIITPDGMDIRPTSDRVREILFNVLEHRDWGKGGSPSSPAHKFSMHSAAPVPTGWKRLAGEPGRRHLWTTAIRRSIFAAATSQRLTNTKDQTFSETTASNRFVHRSPTISFFLTHPTKQPLPPQPCKASQSTAGWQKVRSVSWSPATTRKLIPRLI